MDYKKTARNITATLLVTQALGSLTASVTGTVSTILGEQLSGNTALAGLPGAVLQIGAAAAALVLGVTMDRFGRRLALSASIMFGVIGTVIAALSIISGSFLFFLIGVSLFGVSQAATLMGRFVAAEVHPPQTRGRAISYVIFGGALGSIIGPNLADPVGSLMTRININELVGPYAIGFVVYALAAAIVFIFLRPEPRDIGREIAEKFPTTLVHGGPARSVREILTNPTAVVAIIVMIFGQVVMVGLMGITSLHMINNNHDLGAIGLVFSSHTAGMFLFSIFTGQLLDRWGRGPVILTGATLLFISGAIAPISPDVAPLMFALFLLGLGWNFCYIGGSTLLSDVLTPDERAKTQGFNDLAIALSTATASFTSAVVFDWQGYWVTGIIGATLSLIPLAFVAWWMLKPKEELAV